jgi:CheY-like chemotaxis protein
MRNWHVLVVEDDRYIWEIISRLLEYHGIQVDVAKDAEDALALLAEYQYTLAVIDLALPGMDGWQLLREIKATPEIADMPCVAVTAYHDAKVAHEAIAAGFTAYFPKPLETSFAQALEKVLVNPAG